MIIKKESLEFSLNDIFARKALEKLDKKTVITISSMAFGCANLPLGYILMDEILYHLSDSEYLPKKILLYNEGIKLLTFNSRSLNSLKILESKGVEILLCEISLNYYQIPKDTIIGKICDMEGLLNILMNTSNLLQL